MKVCKKYQIIKALNRWTTYKQNFFLQKQSWKK